MRIQDILKDGITLDILHGNLKNRLEPMDAKAKYINENLPDLVGDTLKKANEALQGKMILPGTGGRPEFVGNPPFWLERRHNDNEFLWQLNRMTHWPPMLEAYSLTKEEKYSKKVIEELINWIDTVEISEDIIAKNTLEYFSGCNPLRVLEIGIRAYKTWPLVLEHLGKSEIFTKEVLEKYLITIYKHAEIIRAISPQIWPRADHNHYLMECLGLLTTALYFPELKKSEEWKEFAIRELERCSDAQLTEEGGQIEGCPSYHNGCMFWFGLVIILSRRFNFKLSNNYLQTYRNNINYALYSLRPTGKTVPVGDSHANNLSIMSGVYGYLAFKDLTWLKMMNNVFTKEEIIDIANEHIWRALDVEDFIKDLKTIGEEEATEIKLKKVFWNSELKQAMIRSSWEKDALSFLFTCRSPIKNLHAHIDLMSFDFTALGKDIICDPGIFCYRDDEDRREFKSSAYHSTLIMDDRDHFEYISSFNYGPQKFGTIYKAEEEEFYSYASAYHKCYEPATHYRHIALVNDELLMVIDEIDKLNNSKINRIFHLDYTNIEKTENYVDAFDEQANVRLINHPKANVEIKDGRLSDINDISRSSKRVIYETIEEKEGLYITLIIPYKENIKEDIKIEVVEEQDYKKVSFNYKNNYKVILKEHNIKISKEV